MVFQYTVDPYSQTFKLTLHHWLEPASYMRDNCIINYEPFLGGSALIFNAVESNIQLINILIYSNRVLSSWCLRICRHNSIYIARSGLENIIRFTRGCLNLGRWFM